MLSKDPRRRPSAHSLLLHPWLQSHLSLPPPLSTSSDLSVLTRLRDFQASSKLRQAALHLISTQIVKPEHFKEMREIFMALDTNRDGRLSMEEIRAGFQAFSGTKRDIIEAAMLRNSESIEFSEFLTATMRWSQVLDRHTIESAFETMDTDGDGIVTGEELRVAIEGTDERVDEETWREVLKEANIDEKKGVRCMQMSIGEFFAVVGGAGKALEKV